MEDYGTPLRLKRKFASKESEVPAVPIETPEESWARAKAERKQIDELYSESFERRRRQGLYRLRTLYVLLGAKLVLKQKTVQQRKQISP